MSPATIDCLNMADNHKPLCYEPLLASFQEWAQPWLEKVPEADMLLLTVSWLVGQNDFPAGAVAGRQITVEGVLRLLRQLSKSSNELAAALARTASQAARTAMPAAGIGGGHVEPGPAAAPPQA